MPQMALFFLIVVREVAPAFTRAYVYSWAPACHSYYAYHLRNEWVV